MKRKKSATTKRANKRSKMAHDAIQETNLASLPNETILHIGEKLDKINDILSLDTTCKMLHSLIELPSFWRRLIDIWFGPSQLLIDAFGNNSHSIQYQFQLIRASSLYDPVIDLQFFHSQQFKNKVKIKFIFHAYLEALKHCIRSRIGVAFSFSKKGKYKAFPIPRDRTFIVHHPQEIHQQQPFKVWSFTFNAFDEEWIGYAMLFTNGSWFITPVQVTIQLATQVLTNFANYIFKERNLPTWNVPKDQDAGQWTLNKLLNQYENNDLYCFWPFQKGPNDLCFVHPNLVFVLFAVSRFYCFQVYPLANSHPQDVKIVHYEDHEWQ